MSEYRLLRPGVGQHHEARNPSGDNSFADAEDAHELTKGLVAGALYEAGEPEDTPKPPYDAVQIIAAVVVCEAENACRDGVDCYEERVPSVKASIKVEDLVQSYIKVGEGEEQPGSAFIEPESRLSNACAISKGDNVED